MGRSLALSSSDELKSESREEKIFWLTRFHHSRFAAATAMSGAIFSRLWPSLDSPRLRVDRSRRLTQPKHGSGRRELPLEAEAHDQRGCRGCPRQSHLLLTSLYNYSYACVRARYQALRALRLNLTFYKLTNSNLYPLIDYHLTSRQTSIGVNWLPNGGERVSIFAEYTRGQSIPTYLCNIEHVSACH